jgi:hypothetical protein
MNNKLLKIINNSPNFNYYKITTEKGDITISDTTIRPCNLFFRALFGKDVTSLPGNGLFKFKASFENVRNYIFDDDLSPNHTINFSANNMVGGIVLPNGNENNKMIKINNLAEIYGDNIYRISISEIRNILSSQQIYLSKLLPIKFYKGLKHAMKLDNIILLPKNENQPLKLKNIPKSNCQKFLNHVAQKISKYGFNNDGEFEILLNMTLYQIGSMVVKTERYYLFVDENGKIRDRQINSTDFINLINMCGIRNCRSESTLKQYNKTIMMETYKTAFYAANNGYVIIPAVGMGVWRGDPELYWTALLDAVTKLNKIENHIEYIFINPGHQKTLYGKYVNCNGNEFKQILNNYLNAYKDRDDIITNLNKIIIINGKDVMQLAYNLKINYPNKTVSLINASDPDVTLGYHVGQYVNSIPCGSTTEENYTAIGTNGLCFEEITNVHNDDNDDNDCDDSDNDDDRIIQSMF